MDGISLSNSFAAIIGLVCSYLSESRASSGDKISDFFVWLEETRHDEVKQLIIENKQLAISLKNIFQLENENILRKLDSLNRSLASVASHLDGFKDIASALKTNGSLSPQAIIILKRFYASNGSIIREMKYRNYTCFQIMDGIRGMIEIEEERYLEEDLRTLCHLNFLMQSVDKQGRVFRLTRQAANFLENMS
jgi:hypothetical protein